MAVHCWCVIYKYIPPRVPPARSVGRSAFPSGLLSLCLVWLSGCRTGATRCGTARRGAARHGAAPPRPSRSGTSLADQTVTVRPATAEEALLLGDPLTRLAASVCGREKEALVTGAHTLRRLVRVKIADDADLDTARRAAVDTANFFRLLKAEAARQSVGASELLRQL